MPTHRTGKYLVYFNGIEVPTQRVDIEIQMGLPPQASITVPPDRELLRLGKEDRLHVAVFYLDTFYRDPLDPGVDAQYRVLFEGEIVSWGYDNTPGGRSLTYRAAGLSNIMSAIQPRIAKNIPAIQESVTNQGATAVDSASAAHTWVAGLFYYGLKADQGKFIKRPFDFVENVFKTLFGSAEFGSSNSSPACHFFARWARRNNFINRWAPSPYIEGQDLALAANGTFPILWASQSNASVQALLAMATNMSTESIGALIQTIFQVMYYEYTSIPNMPLISYDLENGVIVGAPEFGPDNGIYGRGPADPLVPLRIPNHVTKPDLRFCAVPRFNVVFPSMVNTYTFSEQYSTQPTRLYVYDETMVRASTGGHNGLGTLPMDSLRAGYPNKVSRFMKKAEKNIAFNERNFLSFPEEYYRGPVESQIMMPEWFMFLAHSLSANAKAGRLVAGATPEEAKTYADEILRNIYAVYAEFEYIRERSSARSGAVSMCFNPYITPGFPGVIFDREDTGVHTFCYFLNVTHSLSSSGMTTMANYSNAQTFDEFFETLSKQSLGFAAAKTSSAAVAQATSAVSAAQSALDAAIAQNGDGSALVSSARAVLAHAQTALDTATTQSLSTTYTELGAAQEALKKAKADNKDITDAEARVAAAQQALVGAQDALNAPDMAPAHPIPDIRVRFQNLKSADQYYRALFYRNVADGLDAVFNWRNAIGVIDPATETLAPIDLGTLSETYLSSGKTLRSIEGSNLATQIYPAFGLRGAYKSYSEDAELALTYVSRPVATLEDYIDFHGTYGMRDTPVDDDGQTVYYVKILDLHQGPGTELPEDDYGNPSGTLTEDTRQDWETRLLNYREKVKAATAFTA